MRDRDSNPDGGGKPVRLLLGLLAFLLVLTFVTYRPDRPLPQLVPGSSTEPTFVVQVIRPRLGLPLGGLLPPRLFGLDPTLGFDSSSAGAATGRVDSGRIELSAEGWELVLVADGTGRVAAESQVTFELEFEGRRRRVRCRPAEASGAFEVVVLEPSGARGGHFEVELGRCDDAETGVPLGWPPRPFVLRGSFDRLEPRVGDPTE